MELLRQSPMHTRDIAAFVEIPPERVARSISNKEKKSRRHCSVDGMKSNLVAQILSGLVKNGTVEIKKISGNRNLYSLVKKISVS